MKTYSFNDYLNGNYETQNQITRHTKLKMLILDILSLAISFFGFVFLEIESSNYFNQIAFLEYGYRLEEQAKYDNGTYVPTSDPTMVIGGVEYRNHTQIVAMIYKNQNESWDSNILRVLVLVSTLFLVVILMMRAGTYFLYLQIIKKLETDENYYKTTIFKTLMLEIALHCLISYPKANSNFRFVFQTHILYYNWDQLASLIQMGRFYLVYRMWAQYSIWSTEKSTLICNLCNTAGGIFFALKSELKYRPIIATGVNVSLLIFLLGVAVRTSEISFQYVSNLDWDYIWNGMWMIIIIATTGYFWIFKIYLEKKIVGYGDFYPKTIIGRIYVFMTCLLGPFLISLVNVIISNLSVFSREEQKAYENIIKKENTKEIAHRACNCIKFSIKYWGHLNAKLLVGLTKQRSSLNYDFSKFKDSILAFRNLRSEMNAKYYEKPFYQLLPQVSEEMKKEVRDLYETYVTSFQKSEGTVTRIIETQRMIKEKLYLTHQRLNMINRKIDKKEGKKSLKIGFAKLSLKITTCDFINRPKPNLVISIDKLQKSLIFNQNSPTLLVKPNMTMLNNFESLSAIPMRNCIRPIKTTKMVVNDDIFYMEFDDFVKQLKKKSKRRVIKDFDNNSPPNSAQRKKLKNSTMKSIIINEDITRSSKSRIQTVKIENPLQPIKENEENSGTQPNRGLNNYNENEESTERNENFLLIENEKFLRAKNKISTFSPNYPSLSKNACRAKNNKVFSFSKRLDKEDSVKMYKKSLSLDIDTEEVKRNQPRSFENFLIEKMDFCDNESGSV